jgi:type IV secretory pathway VirB6-like protein
MEISEEEDRNSYRQFWNKVFFGWLFSVGAGLSVVIMAWWCGIIATQWISATITILALFTVTVLTINGVCWVVNTIFEIKD